MKKITLLTIMAGSLVASAAVFGVSPVFTDTMDQALIIRVTGTSGLDDSGRVSLSGGGTSTATMSDNGGLGEKALWPIMVTDTTDQVDQETGGWNLYMKIGTAGITSEGADLLPAVYESISVSAKLRAEGTGIIPTGGAINVESTQTLKDGATGYERKVASSTVSGCSSRFTPLISVTRVEGSVALPVRTYTIPLVYTLASNLEA